MGVSIYKLFQVTYSDYISDYDRCLSEFLNDYEDNTELYFIKEQKSILDSHLTKFKDVVMNLVDEDENKEEILDLFRNRINTTDRIKAFLEQRKSDLERKSNLIVPVAKDVNKKKITANQLALMMVYEGNTLVTREEHGNDLYNKVMKWAKVKTRTANDGTNLQLENKIRMFEVVIELLDDRYKQKAIDEVKILKSYLPKN